MPKFKFTKTETITYVGEIEIDQETLNEWRADDRRHAEMMDVTAEERLNGEWWPQGLPDVEITWEEIKDA